MMKIKGLDELMKNLDDLGKKAKELDGKHEISFNELLNPKFLSKHTRFANVQEMFDASGYKVESKEDFASIPDDKWDEFIRSASSFDSWQSMLNEAGKEWTAKKLGF